MFEKEKNYMTIINNQRGGLLARKFALDGQSCRIPRLQTALDVGNFESQLTHLVGRRWENTNLTKT
jgi:hypothetical protein